MLASPRRWLRLGALGALVGLWKARVAIAVAMLGVPRGLFAIQDGRRGYQLKTTSWVVVAFVGLMGAALVNQALTVSRGGAGRGETAA